MKYIVYTAVGCMLVAHFGTFGNLPHIIDLNTGGALIGQTVAGYTLAAASLYCLLEW